MKKFILHGEMADMFCSSISLNTNTMRETILGICANFRGFKKYYLDQSIKGVRYIFINNKQDIMEEYCMDLPLTDDTYHIVPALDGSSGADLLGLGQGLLMGFVMQKISDMFGGPEEDDVPEYEIIETNSFLYTQNENRVEQGTPVPVVYGQLRVGSKVIQSSIQNYDYDYEKAEIYSFPAQPNNFTKIIDLGPSEYSTIDASEIQDLRMQTEFSDEPFSSYKDKSQDPTKRAAKNESKVDGSNVKVRNQNFENENVNQFYGNNDNSNVQRHFGPSIGTPLRTSAGVGWWDHGDPATHRPFLYPLEGHLDYNMRPTEDHLCVSRTVIRDVIQNTDAKKNYAWIGSSNEDYMRIGSRGAYQKLESIAINKSLEILSEGPIVGLANPIVGFDRDNGKANHPYGAESLNFASNAIRVEAIKYNASTNSLVSKSNSSTLTIINQGNGYKDGTYNLNGAGSSVDGLSLTMDAPTKSSSPGIGTATFQDPLNLNFIENGFNNVVDNENYFVSNNKLFLLRQSDGEFLPNTNTNNSFKHPLSSKYLKNEANETTADTSDLRSKVFQLDALSQDKVNLGINFSIGNGVGADGFEIEVEPVEEHAEIEFDVVESSPSQRISSSRVLDLSSYMNFIRSSNFMTMINLDYLNYDGNTPKNSNSGWDEMVRIYYDGDDTINQALDRSTTINVGSHQWFSRTDVTRCTSNSVTITLTITLREYITLAKVKVNSYSKTASSSLCTRASTSISYGGGGSTWNSFVSGQQSVELGALINESVAFQEKLNTELCDGINMTEFNGRSFPKFGVGSGSNMKTRLYTNRLSTYSLLGANDNFDNVKIVENGTNPNDDSDNKKGFYCPFLFPRITIYTMRRSTIRVGGQNGTDQDAVYACPTKINAVARINSSGTVESVHLISVPDNPVWDPELETYTPIFPHNPRSGGSTCHGNFVWGTPPANGEDDIRPMLKTCQDMGIACDIDNSNGSSSLKVMVDRGKLSILRVREESHSILGFADLIKTNPTFGSSACPVGLIPTTNSKDELLQSRSLTRNITLDSLPTEWNNPSNPGIAALTLEQINLAGSKIASLPVDIFDTTTTTIRTGRPNWLNLTAGSGYTKKNQSGDGAIINFDLYEKTNIIQQINVSNNGQGYKPNDEFYVFIAPRSKTSGSVLNGYFSAKAKATINKYGQLSSFEIIDNGYGFNNPNDCVFSNDSSISNDQRNAAIAVNAIQDDTSENIDPSINFPKRNLILKVDDSYLRVSGKEGRVTKFYIKQTGLGFGFRQGLSNPFSASSFQVPEFRAVISEGKLTSLQITDSGKGYSIDDKRIQLNFSSPNGAAVIDEDVDNDAMAWARSIFLNDIPIRDKQNRFNFSKFHFDMRVGHYKNGRLEKLIPNELLSDDSSSSLMSREFCLPSHTKIIDAPLYGPRNDGEKDDYISHTIKNPEVSSITVSIQLDELHYVYEGDESSVYINLIPLLAAGVGIIAGKLLADAVGAALGPTESTTLDSGGTAKVETNVKTFPCNGLGTGTGVATDNATGKATQYIKKGEMARQGLQAKFFGALAGAIGGLAISYIANYLIKCSDVPFLCFKVGEIIKNSGEIWPAKLAIVIEHGTEGSDLKEDHVVFAGCATSSYVKDIVINLDPPEGQSNNKLNRIVKIYRHNREMDPVNNGIIEARYKLSAKLHSITEHVEGFFSYPSTALIGTRVNSKDMPNIPKKEYLIKGRIVKVPSNYNEINGTYNGIWDGKFTDQWTSNPAWIIYDLLINQRYGCGKYGIKESDIDKWSFYEFAEFCDERIDTVIDGYQNEGSPYQERRHMCNLYIDSQREAYEYIKDLLKLYHSTINFSGGKIYITKDSSISSSGPVMIFSNANVEEGGFSYSSTAATDRITACTVDYLDERDNYMLKSETVEDQKAVSEHGYSHVRVAGNGITRKGEAHRLCWKKILTRQLETEIVSFKSGIRAAYLRVGDVVSVVDNNKSSVHSGGVLVDIVNENTVELDVPSDALANVSSILIAAPQSNYSSWNSTTNYMLGDIVYDDDGSLYRLISNSLNGNASNQNPKEDSLNWEALESNRENQFETYNITDRSGFNVTFDSNLNSNIKPGFAWIIESNNTDKVEVKNFRIKQIKEASPMIYEVIAIEYSEDKYTQVDASTDSLGGSSEQAREYNAHLIETNHLQDPS